MQNDLSYQSLLEESGIVLFRWKHEKDWIVETVSENVISLFGYSAEEFKNGQLTYSDCIHKDDQERFIEEIKSAIDNQLDRLTHTPYRIITKDGERKWISHSTVLIYDDLKQVVNFHGIAQDVTKEQQTKEEFFSLRDRFELAIDATKDGLWDWNPVTNEVFFSSKWKSMLGYEECEIGNTLEEWRSRVHPDDLESTMSDLNAHLEGKTDYYINEHRVLCKDGSYKWILDRGKAMFDDQGKLYRIIGFHTDITEQRQLNEELREAKQQVEKQLHLYQSLIEVLPDYVYEYSVSSGARYYSQNVLEFFDKSDKTYIEDPMHWFNSIHKDDKPMVLKTIENFKAGQSFDIEYRIKNGEGEYRWFRDRSFARGERDGDVIISGIATDITRQKDIEVELSQRVQEEVRKNEEAQAELLKKTQIENQSVLLRNIAHHWRNPLNIVVSGLHLINNEIEAEKINYVHIKQLSSEINNIAVTLSHTINDFTTHLSSGFEESEFDLVQMAEEVLKLITPMKKSYGIACKSQLPNTPILYRGQKPILVQILLFLYYNAVESINRKVIKDAECRKEIALHITQTENFFEISLKDSGTQFSEEALKHLFEPYSSDHKLRSGKGLSLYHAYKIVRASGGDMKAQNLDEGGAEVLIFLPIRR